MVMWSVCVCEDCIAILSNFFSQIRGNTAQHSSVVRNGNGSSRVICRKAKEKYRKDLDFKPCGGNKCDKI